MDENGIHQYDRPYSQVPKATENIHLSKTHVCQVSDPHNIYCARLITCFKSK